MFSTGFCKTPEEHLNKTTGLNLTNASSGLIQKHACVVQTKPTSEILGVTGVIIFEVSGCFRGCVGVFGCHLGVLEQCF